jgi:hypothetical protein
MSLSFIRNPNRPVWHYEEFWFSPHWSVFYKTDTRVTRLTRDVQWGTFITHHNCILGTYKGHALPVDRSITFWTPDVTQCGQCYKDIPKAFLMNILMQETFYESNS